MRKAFAREKQATADISHELRTPLAALLTTIDLALRKQRSGEEYREMLSEFGLLGAAVVGFLITLQLLDFYSDGGTKAPAPELAQKVARRCLELGMMTSVVRGGFGIFRIAPPLTIARSEIDLALDVFDRAIRDSLG